MPSASNDLVHDSGLFHHLPPRRRLSYLALLAQILKPGGHFSLTCFGASSSHSELSDDELYTAGDLGGDLSYSADSLRAIFNSYDEIELRAMNNEPATSPLFGEPFLWVGLFRRPRR